MLKKYNQLELEVALSLWIPLQQFCMCNIRDTDFLNTDVILVAVINQLAQAVLRYNGWILMVTKCCEIFSVCECWFSFHGRLLFYIVLMNIQYGFALSYSIHIRPDWTILKRNSLESRKLCETWLPVCNNGQK